MKENNHLKRSSEPLPGVLRNMGKSVFIFGENGNKCIYFRGTGYFLLHFGEQGNIGFKIYYKIMHFHISVFGLPSLYSKIMIVKRVKVVTVFRDPYTKL